MFALANDALTVVFIFLSLSVYLWLSLSLSVAARKIHRSEDKGIHLSSASLIALIAARALSRHLLGGNHPPITEHQACFLLPDVRCGTTHAQTHAHADPDSQTQDLKLPPSISVYLQRQFVTSNCPGPLYRSGRSACFSSGGAGWCSPPPFGICDVSPAC